MEEFIVYPAIDLRNGQIVRLQQGDPKRQTTFGDDPAAAARRWLDDGAKWLHVVNLDGAFGESDSANRQALGAILEAAGRYSASVQFGGGMRSLESVEKALDLGASRVILGTVIVKQPEIVSQALSRWGADKIVAGLDARDGRVKISGWQEGTNISALNLARKLSGDGLKWLVYTDIARDGIGTGVNIEGTVELAKESGLWVIASGGVRGVADVQKIKEAGLPGVIIGRALYDGAVHLKDIL
jgi:phosphoribosylformimino-5-aminoimidazole carboxamide ribotide isomerase